MILNEHKKRITESKDIAEIMTLVLSKEEPFDQQKEHFWVIGVNQRNVIQYIELVSLGCLTSSLVHPREVFRMAIHKGIACIICVHNHPSGELEPSPEDIKITERLKSAGEIIGIRLLDHVLIGNGNPGFKSFRKDGLLA